MTFILTVMMVAAPLLIVPPATSTAAHACPDLRTLDGVGLVCPIRPGLYEVFSPAGASLGFTHGLDMRHSAPEAAPELQTFADGSPPPHCVDGAPGTHYIRVIYARASDDVDRFATMLPIIRREVGEANALVDDAAIATGDRLNLRLRCVGTDIAVDNVVLPTNMVNASFSTIVTDLRAKGYTDFRQKHWVYYDDGGACACLGVGHIYLDETPGVDNKNNGPASAEPMFAVVFDSPEQHSMLHELAHTLGAVQDGAPYSTLAGHCYDGRDTMCYNDGGPRGPLYTVSACTTAVFDCGKNTYCNAYPDPGTYLALHWQVCTRLSRYLTYPPNQAPIVIDLSCSPSPSYPGESVKCTFRASDAGPKVYYTFDWGDGTTLRVPATGTVPTTALQTVERTFSTAGVRPVRVIATDIGSPPLSSAPAEFSHEVLPALPPPALDPISCSPEFPIEGETVTCTVRAVDANPLVYNLTWGDGSATVRLPATGSAPSGEPQTASHVYGRGGDYAVNVTATDEGRPPKSSTASLILAVEDVNTVPVMTFLQCSVPKPRPGQSVPCSFRANDDSNGVAYLIDWGDGTTQRIPESGWVQPGTLQVAYHTFAADGNYTLNVRATDDGVPPMTSTPLMVLQSVAADQEGPTITITEPRGGLVYRGCSKLDGPPVAVSPTPIFLQRGCVSVILSDPAGISHLEVVRGTTVIARTFSAPWELTFDVPNLEPDADYRIRAWDTKGNARLVSFTAHAFGGSAER